MFVFGWDRWFVWKRWVGHSVMCIISGMPKPWFKVGKSSIQYPFVFYEGNMFLTFTISSAMVSRHDEKSIKIHSEGGHPKNRQVLCFSPTYNYKLPAKKKPSEFTLVMFRWDPHCQRQKKSLRSWGKLKCQSETSHVFVWLGRWVSDFP